MRQHGIAAAAGPTTSERHLPSMPSRTVRERKFARRAGIFTHGVTLGRATPRHWESALQWITAAQLVVARMMEVCNGTTCWARRIAAADGGLCG